MEWYRLYNRRLKLDAVVETESAQEACQSQGWMIGDCWVMELAQEPHDGPLIYRPEPPPNPDYLPGKMRVRRTEFKGFRD